MLGFLIELLRFAFQATIIVAGIIIVIGFIFTLINRGKDAPLVKVKNINKRLKSYRNILNKSLLGKKELKKQSKQQKKDKKKKDDRPRLFVINFKGDIKASSVEQLREEVTAILEVIADQDRVMVNIDSPGGMVNAYGLASSQLQRFKDKGVPLTICVDKVAASGGYMMACLGDEILAAPFAIVGSIGVLASMPNFNRILEKNEIDFLEITAGEYKRTLTPLGKVTDQGMKKFKEQIEDIHVLFKDHVKTARPQLDIDKVSTGEYWFGLRAKELNLVDQIKTSDDYLTDMADSHKVFEIKFEGKKTFKEKLAESMSAASEQILVKAWSKIWASRWMH